MARGHARAAWSETSELIAAIVNHAGFGTNKPVTAEQFNPFIMAEPHKPYEKVSAREFAARTGMIKDGGRR